jgi:hypothetical protein
VCFVGLEPSYRGEGGVTMQCSAIKRDGTGRCERIVHSDSGLCFAHDPTFSEARKKAASKAGRAGKSLRTSGEVSEIKAELKRLAQEVREGKLSRSDAIALNQIYNSLLRAAELEYKVSELAEVQETLKDYEEDMRRRGAL